MISVFDYLSGAEQTDVRQGTLTTDVTTHFQEAIDAAYYSYSHTASGGAAHQALK